LANLCTDTLSLLPRYGAGVVFLSPAGISEGLLSGCCGILNESVRRQIYVVRTSGARLLALINDVMDAAALRQHRLVLKQERLELRQVVGDVSDLTRSLVDNDVSLRNEVPEGMLVWADSGRIIQVR
jgi:signal transduction histidine kinase